ncbi:hypothetical protein [Levilactobacillus senmaizukei]|nr:hypothetical protein [Levilactobacillus senmaizukei]
MHWGAEVNRYRATRHLKGWMVAAAILTEIGGPFVTPVEALAATPANVEQTLVDRPGAEFLGSSSSSDKSREESHSEASPAAAEVPESETAVTDAEATNETATMESTDKPKKPDTPRPTSAKSKRPREASKPATESIDQWMPNKRLQRAIFYQLTHLSPVPDDDKT